MLVQKIPRDSQLRGELPKELGNLSQLQNMLLHANNLSGEVPFELFELANWAAFTLGQNSLSVTLIFALAFFNPKGISV